MDQPYLLRIFPTCSDRPRQGNRRPNAGKQHNLRGAEKRGKLGGKVRGRLPGARPERHTAQRVQLRHLRTAERGTGRNALHDNRGRAVRHRDGFLRKRRILSRMDRQGQDGARLLSDFPPPRGPDHMAGVLGRLLRLLSGTYVEREQAACHETEDLPRHHAQQEDRCAAGELENIGY